MKSQNTLSTRWARLGVTGLALVAAVAPGLMSGRLPVAEAQQRPQQKIGETTVTAEDLEYDVEKRQYIFDGNVELVSGNTRMTANKMTVQISKDKEMESARCEGKVVLDKKNPEAGTTLNGRSDTLEYLEKAQKANLAGNVEVRTTSPRLSQPAVVTGSRIDMDLKTQENVVHRSPDAQAKVHVQPKGTEGKPAPEPVDLIADKIEMNSLTQEYVATGKPVMVRPSTKLQAKTIRFQVDEKTNEVNTARADGDVIYDGRGEKGNTVRATGDTGTFDRETNMLVLEGMVQATVKEAGEEQPSVYQGKKFQYNNKTGWRKLSGGVIVNIPSEQVKPKKPDMPAASTTPAAATETTPAAADKDKK